MLEAERTIPPEALSFEAFTRLVERQQHPLHAFLRGLVGDHSMIWKVQPVEDQSSPFEVLAVAP